MSASVCAEPLDLAVLMDYWLGDLDADQEARVEEHILDCPACSERMGDLLALPGIRRSTAG